MQGYVEQFKQMRGVLGLTQSALADRIGMSRVSISRMERGEMPIDIRTLYSLRYLHLEFVSKMNGIPWRYPDDSVQDNRCNMSTQKVTSCDKNNKNRLKRLRKKKK